jgi:hypothetical protein
MINSTLTSVGLPPIIIMDPPKKKDSKPEEETKPSAAFAEKKIHSSERAIISLHQSEHSKRLAFDLDWEQREGKSIGDPIFDEHHTYKQHFNDALKKAEQIFKLIFQEQDSLILPFNAEHQEEIWKTFKGKTSLGRSISLAHSILENGRILNVKELKEIERTDTFITTAQTIQLVTNFLFNYNEKKQKLLLLQEDDPKKYVDSWQKERPEHFQAKDKKLEEDQQLMGSSHQITSSNLHLIKSYNLLQKNRLHDIKSIKIEQICHIETQDSLDKIKRFASRIKSHLSLNHQLLFQAMVLISINDTKEHTALLEIDKTNNTYILYDDIAFYQWNDLNSCILDIAKRFTLATKGLKNPYCEFMMA